MGRVCVCAAVVASVALAALGGGAASRAEGGVVRCHAAVSRAVLPVWAQTGFHGGPPRTTHVVGRQGQIAAIVFGYPLRASSSTPTTGHGNKILWVSRTLPASPAALWIRAQQMTGTKAVGAPVGRVLMGGPGPSYVNLPRPGCWRLQLSWSGRKDTLDLAYGSGS